MQLLFLTILFFILPFTLVSQEQQIIIPYTLADRDRAIRTEERLNVIESDLKDLKKEMKEGTKGLDDKINRLEDKFDMYFMWEFGLVLVAIFGLVGFIIYDRKTILAPIESKTNRIINVLQDAAEQNPTIKESLKKNTLNRS